MTPRREIVLSALLFLAACGAAASSAPGDGSTRPTVGTVAGVGVLPEGVAETLGYVDPAPTDEEVASSSTTIVGAVGDSAVSNRVIVIGDSLTASASPRYGGQLCDVLVPAGWQVEIDAETSRFIEFGQTVLKSRLSAGWNVAVIFLGNNYNGDQLDYAVRLNDMVTKLGDIPIVVLTVTEFRPKQEQVNEAIQTVADLHANVRVLDWRAIADADASRILGSDGLHLTEHGRQALADAVGLTLGAAPAQPGKCLASNFVDDSEGSVTGTTTTVKGSSTTRTTVKATGTTVKPTGTTVRSTTTTVKAGGTTTSPPTATTVAPTTPATSPPATTSPPPPTTAPPSDRDPATT
jgi:hypothetical protein